LLSNENSTIEDIGDEPLQYRLKYKDIIVAVDEKRVNGIKEIKRIHPETETILLDDAYQHRSVKPGINILITEFNKLYCNDYVIPSGRLRELPAGSKRADIIIVSKSLKKLSNSERNQIIKALSPDSSQSVYFSFIEYGKIKAFTSKAKETVCNENHKSDLLLLTGIAKPAPLVEKLTQDFNSIEHIKYSDHHSFTKLDITNIKDTYQNIESNNKIIITTEKDIMRLSLPSILKQIQDIPIFYIPIEICFHGDDKKEFDQKILDYVATNSRN
jgi:tetraacyldisaccharide 4'-kinase